MILKWNGVIHRFLYIKKCIYVVVYVAKIWPFKNGQLFGELIYFGT